VLPQLSKRVARVAPAVAALAWSASASATLIFEPVISHYPGTGPGDMVFPLYDPTYFNLATGEQVSIASKPGELDYWSMGYPREEVMVDFGMYNNTAYNITSLTMTIIGNSVETIPGAAWVVDPNHIDALFGDANGDGKVGVSDVFATITVSADGHTLTLSNGAIPAGSHFTDYIFSYITDDDPRRQDGTAFAALEGRFDGVLAPEPATWTLLLAAVSGLCILRRRKPPPA
jgi:hypothetical protein